MTRPNPRFPRRFEPRTGQESVWDYPRPPKLEPCPNHLRVEHLGLVLADTRRGWRVLETSHPPVYYLPPEDVRMERLLPAPGSSWCEWKGQAHYYAARDSHGAERPIAWSYADPTPEFAAIRGHLAFYPARVSACFVDDELVIPQPGEFYGGWITSRVVGPFKGEPGTMHW